MIILGSTLAGGLAGRYATEWYYREVPHLYESTAQILVIGKNADRDSPLVETLPGMFHLGSHAILVKSPFLIQHAVEKHQLYKLASFKEVQPQLIARIIREGLTTVVTGNELSSAANILEIRYRSTLASDATSVVKAMLRTYQDFLNENMNSVSDEAIRRITQSSKELQASLSKDRMELQRFVREAPVGTTLKPDQQELDLAVFQSIRAEREKVAERRGRVQSQIETIEEAKIRGKSFALILMFIANQQESDIADTKDRHQLEQQRDQTSGATKEAQIDEAAQQIDTYLDARRLELTEYEKQDRVLSERYKAAEKEAQYLQSFQAQYKLLMDEIDGKKEIVTMVSDRLRQIDLTMSQKIKTIVIETPGEAQLIYPDGRQLTISGIIGGCIVGFILSTAITRSF